MKKTIKIHLRPFSVNSYRSYLLAYPLPGILIFKPYKKRLWNGNTQKSK